MELITTENKIREIENDILNFKIENFDDINKLEYIDNQLRLINDVLVPNLIIPTEPVGIPEKYVKISEKCTCKTQWNIGVKLGYGNGNLYEVCKTGNCSYTLKIQDAGNIFETEVKTLYALQNWKHSPKIYATWTCEGKGYIIMEKVYKLKKINYSNIIGVLQQLHKMKRVHGDLHSGNIMNNKNGDIMFTDFGHSCYFPTGTELCNTMNSKMLLHPLNFELAKRMDYVKFQQSINIQTSLKIWNKLKDIQSQPIYVDNFEDAKLYQDSGRKIIVNKPEFVTFTSDTEKDEIINNFTNYPNIIFMGFEINNTASIYMAMYFQYIPLLLFSHMHTFIFKPVDGYDKYFTAFYDEMDYNTHKVVFEDFEYTNLRSIITYNFPLNNFSSIKHIEFKNMKNLTDISELQSVIYSNIFDVTIHFNNTPMLKQFDVLKNPIMRYNTLKISNYSIDSTIIPHLNTIFTYPKNVILENVSGITENMFKEINNIRKRSFGFDTLDGLQPIQII